MGNLKQTTYKCKNSLLLLWPLPLSARTSQSRTCSNKMPILSSMSQKDHPQPLIKPALTWADFEIKLPRSQSVRPRPDTTNKLLRVDIVIELVDFAIDLPKPGFVLFFLLKLILDSIRSDSSSTCLRISRYTATFSIPTAKRTTVRTI